MLSETFFVRCGTCWAKALQIELFDHFLNCVPGALVHPQPGEGLQHVEDEQVAAKLNTELGEGRGDG